MRHCEPSQILNRFPIQNRREQARQQSSAGTARPPDKACKPPPRRRSEREVGNRLRRCESSQILNRFPIQNRRDQARQQMSADTVRPTKRASRHHGGAASGKLGTGCRCEPSQTLNRFPIQNRRDQARQQSSADAVRPPDKARKPPPRRRSEREVGNNPSLRTNT